MTQYNEADSVDGSELVQILQGANILLVPLYKIRALTAPTIATTPVGFTATTFDFQQIDLAWTSGATNYILERSFDENQWLPIYSGAGNSFSDTILAADTQYFYRLKAQQAGEFDSAWTYDNDTTDAV